VAKLGRIGNNRIELSTDAWASLSRPTVKRG